MSGTPWSEEETGMLIGRRASKFIRRFGGPGEDSGIVCFRFGQLVPARGCPFRCSGRLRAAESWRPTSAC